MAFGFLPHAVLAQAVGRIECPADDDYEDETVHTLGEKGLLLQMRSKDADDGKRTVKSEWYSCDMKLLGSETFSVPKKMACEHDDYADGVNYTVWRDKDDNLKVLAFDPESGKTAVHDGTLDHKLNMRWCSFGSGRMVFATTEKKTEKLNVFNLASGQTKTLDLHFPGVKDRNTLIFATAVVGSEVLAFVNAEGHTMLVRTDLDGNQIGVTEVTPDEGETITSASICNAGGRTFVTGTYTKSKKGNSQGIYFAALDKDDFAFYRSYNFLDLKNFTEFMSEKKQKKVERKKQKAEKADKEYALNYFMASHDIVFDGKDYYYLGEAYYPTYVTYRQGNVIVTSFNGYQYTHAILVKFDAGGNLLWDTCFPMYPKNKPFRVIHFASMGLDDGRVSLVYADRMKLVSKIVGQADGGIVQEKETGIIEAGDENVDVKKMKMPSTCHWYDNNYVVYGQQYVKDKSGGNRRKVFGITKYTIQ